MFQAENYRAWCGQHGGLQNLPNLVDIPGFNFNTQVEFIFFEIGGTFLNGIFNAAAKIYMVILIRIMS